MIGIVLIAPVRAYRDAQADVINSEPGCKLIAHSESGSEAMALISPRKPAVALLDFGTDELMPVLLALRRSTPTTRLLGIGVRAEHAQADTVVLAAESGVQGFVDADQPLINIVGAIRLAAAAQSPCTPRIATVLLRALQRPPTPILRPVPHPLLPAGRDAASSPAGPGAGSGPGSWRPPRGSETRRHPGGRCGRSSRCGRSGPPTSATPGPAAPR
ncbi:hypothetical protein [Krasilnikovia sp. M28-CT-15]|uniref:hypothetical protein n=1 Tax=Krasilnikovia sp. M28-CT-15 TaxID=3373540 RepID=UPI00399D4236